MAPDHCRPEAFLFPIQSLPTPLTVMEFLQMKRIVGDSLLGKL
jgi:hypothetical protein